MTNKIRLTPLHSDHIKRGGRLVEFAGFEMPLYYSSVLKEHEAVRNKAGFFDVSHMGNIWVKGPRACEFLNYVTVNDVKRLAVGKGQYTLMCNHSGGVVDDLLLYRLGTDDYFLCINAANRTKDYNWLCSHGSDFPGVKIFDESDQWGQIAIQGPKSLEVLEMLFKDSCYEQILALSYTGIAPISYGVTEGFIARTGYTGEKGYELYIKSEGALSFWQDLLTCGEKIGALPTGLGCRDTLRLEACYLLYGNDLTDTVSPLEGGVTWAVRFDKGDFLGRSALLKEKESGSKRALVAFKMIDAGIPRKDMGVYYEGESVGIVTSGSVLPSLGASGGLALVSSFSARQVSNCIHIDIRG